ncbi:MAG: exodeoxyribonuclease VII small subunit [Desulfurella sp.]|jgi:exodeoxyribonuclease VII small subunit|uniref:Exodeoxyribonuclease 7 small subunit n=1 Tax=Desulfurella multipotens TaxID=79269 RepID=A0A1G6ITJ8_9BACT|nr:MULTISPECIES: exodeoxyribonuclease VII small subunit [Desulfurella]AHF97511.1 exodeoxyribonuclease VII small subunit [Desulfurella acetivorans A63]HEX13143.1 exodeoxyribonuclease VII small subunit [Desulfurella acetivorans]PMP68168.1 MAG: exodeoxyribonuclease VII small subunit [Desulfurella multipotens]PMP93689.1 MAG: exodeoxyribonuclease VII small subunit [Desulfurella sp.]SDC09751.1 Exodeoxyribonuclease VII small subunit [Desulfurella multipotens]
MNQELSFEQALKRLEEIAQKLEQENLNLEDALKYFEEGMELSKFCSLTLQKAENKVKVIMKDSEVEMEDLE